MRRSGERRRCGEIGNPEAVSPFEMGNYKKTNEIMVFVYLPKKAKRQI